VRAGIYLTGLFALFFLFVSEATVKTHLLRASAKLGVSGRTAAVTKAIETGALPAPGQPR
jgi:hypothetical protein